jgi:hypothetical protein
MTSNNLLATATPWHSANDSSSGKKKPLMTHLTPHRKTQKKVSFPDDHNSDSEHSNISVQEGFAQRQAQNEEKISKVESILNQMNTLDLENDGSGLANFNPVPRPELQPLDDLQSKFPVSPKFQEKHDRPDESPIQYGYLANDSRLFDEIKGGSSYDQSYSTVPYYAKMGNGNRHFPNPDGGTSGQSSLLIEKINYMIHLLEQQQFEKTDNIMEEFFLYLLLGGFMIYVVDSFTKTGRYIR